MRKLIGLVVGFSLGAVISAALALLWIPTLRASARQNLRHNLEKPIDEARQASLHHRSVMEAQLAAMRSRKNAPPRSSFGLTRRAER